jgi:uncharacterized protein (TIGR00255 family)
MTGYGTAEGIVGKGRLYIEVKTVNHRFCDINLKIPPRMGVLESYARKYLQDKFSRGKVDIFFKEKNPLFGGVKLSVDIELAKQYQKNFKKLARSLGLPRDADFLEYVGLDKFVHLEEKEGSYEKLWRQIEALLRKATNRVRAMQEREGNHLMKQQRKCIDIITKLVARIRKESLRALRQNERRLRRRLVGAKIRETDEQRLQMELALMGGKQDIDEELTRLESHINQCRELLKVKEPVGRRFDFLLQEMNREVNTIGSKAADATISRMVVDSKAQLEKLREQVQNIE